MIGGQIVVEPDQRIEPAEGGSAAGVFAARRGGALVGDAVADEVPARRRGEDQLVAVEQGAARQAKGVLEEGAERVLPVAHLRIEIVRAEHAHLDVAVGVLEAHADEVPLAQHRAGAIELDRPSRRSGARQQPAVFPDQVHVELLDVEQAAEPVRGNREALSEVAPPVERELVQPGGEEVAGGVVRGAVRVERGGGERARLRDAVVRMLVGERQVGAVGAEADLPEQLGEPRVRRIPPAVLLRLGPGQVEVDGTRPAGDPDPVLLQARAPRRDFRGCRAALLAAPGDEVDRAGERVPAEDDRRSRNHLDAIEVLGGQQVEVDLLGGRLVDAHAVEEHAHALGDAGDGGGLEPAQGEIRLVRVPLLVGERQPGNLAGQRVRQAGNAGPPQLLDIEHLHGRRDARGRQRRLRQAPDHHDVLGSFDDRGRRRGLGLHPGGHGSASLLRAAAGPSGRDQEACSSPARESRMSIHGPAPRPARL